MRRKGLYGGGLHGLSKLAFAPLKISTATVLDLHSRGFRSRGSRRERRGTEVFDIAYQRHDLSLVRLGLEVEFSTAASGIHFRELVSKIGVPLVN